MKTTQIFDAKQKALDTERNLTAQFEKLTGLIHNICSPEKNPFAVFYPKTRIEYLAVLDNVLPTDENAEVTFAGKDAIQTFSPYLVTYGGEHSSPNYIQSSKILF